VRLLRWWSGWAALHRRSSTGFLPASNPPKAARPAAHGEIAGRLRVQYPVMDVAREKLGGMARLTRSRSFPAPAVAEALKASDYGCDVLARRNAGEPARLFSLGTTRTRQDARAQRWDRHGRRCACATSSCSGPRGAFQVDGQQSRTCGGPVGEAICAPAQQPVPRRGAGRRAMRRSAARRVISQSARPPARRFRSSRNLPAAHIASPPCMRRSISAGQLLAAYQRAAKGGSSTHPLGEHRPPLPAEGRHLKRSTP